MYVCNQVLKRPGLASYGTAQSQLRTHSQTSCLTHDCSLRSTQMILEQNSACIES